MASQAPGEPTNRRNSGRKRNADTYRKTATPPFEVLRATLGGGSASSSLSTTVSFIYEGELGTIFPVATVRLEKNGNTVHMYLLPAFGTGNTLLNNFFLIPAGTIPADYRPGATVYLLSRGIVSADEEANNVVAVSPDGSVKISIDGGALSVFPNGGPFIKGRTPEQYGLSVSWIV